MFISYCILLIACMAVTSFWAVRGGRAWHAFLVERLLGFAFLGLAVVAGVWDIL